MWRITHHQATWVTDSWRATLNLLRPDLGLVQESADGEALVPWQLFGVQTAAPREAWQLNEHYVRGQDLVVQYCIAGWDLYPQIYWRVKPTAPSDCSELELLVSIQTSRLDNQPATQVRCQIPATHCRCVARHPVTGRWHN